MTAPRTWDVTLRVEDTDPDAGESPKVWYSWKNAVEGQWDDVRLVEFLSATEVKTWRFGDIITDDNKPDVPFNAVNPKGRTATERGAGHEDGPWRLVWVDGQELV